VNQRRKTKRNKVEKGTKSTYPLCIIWENLLKIMLRGPCPHSSERDNGHTIWTKQWILFNLWWVAQTPKRLSLRHNKKANKYSEWVKKYWCIKEGLKNTQPKNGFRNNIMIEANESGSGSTTSK
jgi:hypothetical protein